MPRNPRSMPRFGDGASYIESWEHTFFASADGAGVDGKCSLEARLAGKRPGWRAAKDWAPQRLVIERQLW